jgi:hypothetical protein
MLTSYISKYFCGSKRVQLTLEDGLIWAEIYDSITGERTTREAINADHVADAAGFSASSDSSGNLCVFYWSKDIEVDGEIDSDAQKKLYMGEFAYYFKSTSHTNIGSSNSVQKRTNTIKLKNIKYKWKVSLINDNIPGFDEDGPFQLISALNERNSCVSYNARNGKINVYLRTRTDNELNGTKDNFNSKHSTDEEKTYWKALEINPSNESSGRRPVAADSDIAIIFTGRYFGNFYFINEAGKITSRLLNRGRFTTGCFTLPGPIRPTDVKLNAYAKTGFILVKIDEGKNSLVWGSHEDQSGDECWSVCDCRELAQKAKDGIIDDDLEADNLLDFIDIPVKLPSEALCMTPLHYACKYGQVHDAVKLLYHGANPNLMVESKNKYGATPIYFAVWQDMSTDTIRLCTHLLGYGAFPNAAIEIGSTPMHRLAKYFYTIPKVYELIKHLKTYGFNIRTQTSFPITGNDRVVYSSRSTPLDYLNVTRDIDAASGSEETADAIKELIQSNISRTGKDRVSSKDRPLVQLIPALRHFKWELIMKESDVITKYQKNIIELIRQFCVIFGHRYNLKLGREILDTRFPSDEAILSFLQKSGVHNKGRSKVIKGRTSDDPRDRERFNQERGLAKNTANHLYNALVDPKVSVVWPISGGYRNVNLDIQATLMRDIMILLFLKLFFTRPSNMYTQEGHQKLIIGYCYFAPIINFLQMKGLARGCHGPLFFELDALKGRLLSATRVRALRSLFSLTSRAPILYSIRDEYSPAGQIVSHNPEARRFIHDRNECTGSIMAGTASVFLDVLEKLSKNHLSRLLLRFNKYPILLVLEFICSSGEVSSSTKNNIDKLRNIIKHNLTLCALFIGFNKDLQESGPQKVIEHESFKKLTKTCNKKYIPMFFRPKFGHLGWRIRPEGDAIPLGRVRLSVIESTTNLDNGKRPSFMCFKYLEKNTTHDTEKVRHKR